MSCYSKLLKNSTEYNELLKAINASLLPSGVTGLPPSPKAHLIHSLCEDTSRRALVILPNESLATRLVNDINEFVKINDVVKMKVLSISDDGKISLSIRKALEKENNEERRERRERKVTAPPPKPDGSYTWTPKKAEPASFEEMMSRFKATSDEKFSDLKRKNVEVRRPKRGTVK